jgi:hypothetical protein
VIAGIFEPVPIFLMSATSTSLLLFPTEPLFRHGQVNHEFNNGEKRNKQCSANQKYGELQFQRPDGSVALNRLDLPRFGGQFIVLVS